MRTGMQYAMKKLCFRIISTFVIIRLRWVCIGMALFPIPVFIEGKRVFCYVIRSLYDYDNCEKTFD